MSLQVAGHQVEGYKISTEVYEGPLDLLLDLIERAELDITRLALAQVTDQYLAYMNQLTDRDPAEVSAFLVIAARLIQIKSAALLPRAPVIENAEPEEDPGEALARQLILYRRFKQLAQYLEFRENQNLHTYLRIGARLPDFETRLEPESITLAEFLKAAREVFSSEKELPSLSQVVSMPRITIRDKIQVILKLLRTGDLKRFSDIFHNRTRVEVVVSFLAMLELVKRHIIEAQQSALFGEIEIQTSDVPVEQLDDVSEFGE